MNRSPQNTEPRQALILTGTGYPIRSGMLKWIEQLGTALAEDGFDVRHLVGSETPTSGWQGSYDLQSLGDIQRNARFRNHYLRGFERFRWVKLLVKQMLQTGWHPRVVMTDSTPSMMYLARQIARQLEIPRLAVVGGNFFNEEPRWILRAMVRRLYQGANGIIVDGADLRSNLSRRGIEADKIHVVPHGVDTAVFRPDVSPEPFLEFLAERGLPSPELGRVILTHGTLKESTGCQEFLRLVSEVRPTAAIVIGTGPLEGAVRVQAAAMNQQVILTGEVPEEILPSALCFADLCAYPFLSMAGVSVAVLEAMSCGRSVVTTDCGSLSELRRDGENLLIAPSADCVEFREAVLCLLDNPERRREIAGLARDEIVRNWSLLARQKDFLKTLYEVIGCCGKTNIEEG